MKRPVFKIHLAVLAMALLPACRDHSTIDTTKYTVDVVDGVRYVHNHAAQSERDPGVALELLGKIGELEATEDKDLLYRPADAARLPNGEILILEEGGCTVKRYSKDHRYVSSFGRKGLGPGDFVSPYLMRLDRKGDRLYFADRFISWFSPAGRFIDSFKPSRARLVGGSIGEQYRTSGMALLSSACVILPSDTSLWEESGEAMLLSVYDDTGTHIRAFGAVARFEDPLMTLNANIVHFATDGADHCYVAYAHQNRVDKYSPDGKLMYSADRPLAYDIRTEMKDEVFTSGAMKRVFSWPSVTSVSKGVFLDGRNRLWVLTYLIQPNRFGGFDGVDDRTRCYRFDVFNSEGILLFTVPVPNKRFNSFSIYDDRMYLVDPDHESCVYEYRIVEK